MTKQNRFGGKTQARQDRLIREERHDTYRATEKLPEPTQCPDCGAVFERGRWNWAVAGRTDSHKTTCPACRRIRDGYPAGYVTLTGSFLETHRDEILHLIKNEAQKQSKEHPLKRIMDIQDKDDGMLVTTTDSHLARSIGESLSHAYQGELDYHYTVDEMLRVKWTRNA